MTLNAAIGTTLGVRSIADVAKNATFVAASESLISSVSFTIGIPRMQYQRGIFLLVCHFSASVLRDGTGSRGRSANQYQILEAITSR
jgi:hypothetical protein